jgi:hypothetical protein
VKVIFRHILTIACALYLSGAHWMVLQMTAWTGMLVSRSADAGMTEAVETTFDGEHPCAMCMAITKAQEQEKKQEEQRLPDVKKLMELRLVVLEVCQLPRSSLSGEVHWVQFSDSANRRADAPPTPPPNA